ncbi:MAG: MGMT family protein [bacterium]|nr:MGMT family protein [bacterium]
MTTFSERVVKIALEIPKGKVMTYGDIARVAGAGASTGSASSNRGTMAAQSITSILSKYEAGLKNTRLAGRKSRQVPFHRIVYADGRIWVSPSRRKERLALYKKEGIKLDAKDRIVNFRDILIDFH